MDIRTPKDFGRRVRQAREALNLTQRDLAFASGVGERFVVELEAGKPTAQLGKALLVAARAGLRLTDGTSGG